MRALSGIHGRAAAYGAVAAVMGAACMTVVRSTARRCGVIEKTVPQVMEEWLASHTPMRSKGSPSLHHALDQVLHLLYGASYGAAYGAIFGGGSRRTVPSGLVLGLAAWTVGSGVILPLTGASRGLWARRAAENGVDLLAHVAFGIATELVRDDLMAHSEEGRPSHRKRRRARAG